MTLAVILFIGFIIVSPIPRAMPLDSSQANPQSAPAQDKPAAPAQDQTTGSSSQTAGAPSKPPASTTTTKAPTKKKPSKGALQHKARPNPDCNSTNGGSAASGTQTPASAPTTTSGSANATASKPSSSSSTTTNCPPQKTVVPQGGTTEHPIQLVGGGASGAQASDERQTATQMLRSTEENLKKAQGTPLNSNQQAMVRQVRDFVDQSKAASQAGDLDRARTLAWKAQLLSEELATPQK